MKRIHDSLQRCSSATGSSSGMTPRRVAGDVRRFQADGVVKLRWKAMSSAQRSASSVIRTRTRSFSFMSPPSDQRTPKTGCWIFCCKDTNSRRTRHRWRCRKSGLPHEFRPSGGGTRGVLSEAKRVQALKELLRRTTGP